MRAVGFVIRMNDSVPEASHNPVAQLGTLELALERTRVAYDRTLMAVVRTATSLISFGFAVYKFFQLDVGHPTKEHLIGPREFALVMVIVGLLSLLSGILEHSQNMRRLRGQYPDMPRSGSMVTAALVAGLGVLALFVVIYRA